MYRVPKNHARAGDTRRTARGVHAVVGGEPADPDAAHARARPSQLPRGRWRVPAAPLARRPPMPANVLHGQLHREEETPEVRLPRVDGDESDNNSDGSEYYDERSFRCATALPAGGAPPDTLRADMLLAGSSGSAKAPVGDVARRRASAHRMPRRFRQVPERADNARAVGAATEKTKKKG